MAEEEVVIAPVPEPSDHKRKFEDLESELVGNDQPVVDPNEDLNRNSIAELVDEQDGANGADSEAKRPRLGDKPPDPEATENGYEVEEKLVLTSEEITLQQTVETGIEAEDIQEQAVPDIIEAEPAVDDDNLQPSNENALIAPKDEEYPAADDDNLQPSDEIPQPELEAEELSKEEFKDSDKQIQDVGEEDLSQLEQEQQSESEPQTTSRKIEVPNAKVGVLIGKGGDTIRFLQLNSGARIQITRDVDADPNAPTRPVQLLGTLENINNAERLIKEVIAEADAGGSPALVARGFNNQQSSGAAEQIEIQVPNAKVGLIIGKGGETIKNLQTRSGARIQLIPQRSSDGEQLSERTVRLTGDKKQIETAEEMIKEVMSQQVRPSSNSRSGYNQPQQQHNGGGGGGPRGPPNSQWGPQGLRPSHSSSGGYDYPQRGPSYPSHTPPPSYNNYPPQQMDPRNNYNNYQRPNPAMQGPPPAGGYNYYNQGGPAPPPNPMYNPAPAPNYNYGQQGQDYGHQQQQQPPPYSQIAPVQNPYGGYGPPQAQSYPPQGPPVNQPYGQNMPAQQPYPFPSPVPAQQTYPAYGSAPVPAPGPGYQTGQPGYGQQAPPVYAQSGPGGGYGQYPPTQPGYAEQPPQNNVGYGYQAPTDQAYGAPAAQGYGAPVNQGYGAPAGGQPAPVQQQQPQPGYDQSVPQSGGY
jgi:far upstream element-binding protein